MVDDPRPPIVQFSDASTESAPFIYFDERAGLKNLNETISGVSA